MLFYKEGVMSIKNFIDDLKTISLEEAKEKYHAVCSIKFITSMHKGANNDKTSAEKIIKFE